MNKLKAFTGKQMLDELNFSDSFHQEFPYNCGLRVVGVEDLYTLLTQDNRPLPTPVNIVKALNLYFNNNTDDPWNDLKCSAIIMTTSSDQDTLYQNLAISLNGESIDVGVNPKTNNKLTLHILKF